MPYHADMADPSGQDPGMVGVRVQPWSEGETKRTQDQHGTHTSDFTRRVDETNGESAAHSLAQKNPVARQNPGPEPRSEPLQVGAKIQTLKVLH